LSQDSKRVEARTSSAYLMVLVAANHFAFRIGARSPVVGLALECFMVTCKDKYQHNKYDNFFTFEYVSRYKTRKCTYTHVTHTPCTQELKRSTKIKKSANSPRSINPLYKCTARSSQRGKALIPPLQYKLISITTHCCAKI